MVAVVVRRELREQIVSIVGECRPFNPRSGAQMRAWLHRIKPRLLIADELAGGPRWRVIPALPRVSLVETQPWVIALMNGLDPKRERLAAMAGCYDAVDLTLPSWPRELRAALRHALKKRPDVHASPVEGSPVAEGA
jgi:hypothetical protein